MSLHREIDALGGTGEGEHHEGKAAPTLEQQLDALIAEHDLSAITLTRIRVGERIIWGINVQGDGFCGSNGLSRPESAAAGLRKAIEDLNSLRVAPVLVPDLAAAA